MSSKEIADAVLMVIKQFAKWIFWGILALLIVLLLGYGAYTGYDAWKSRPIKMQSLKGIYLDDSLSDFIFKNEKFEKMNDDTNGLNYRFNGVDVYFKNEKVSDVSLFCHSGEFVFIDTDANGISCGSSSDEILKKYGKDVNVYCDKGNSRLYEVPKYNAYYYLTANKVQIIQIAQHGTMSDSWSRCGK